MTAVLALSGVYDSFDSFGDYMVTSSTATRRTTTSPACLRITRISGMYNERKIILCVGQGAWEDVLKESTSRIKGVLDAKGIHAWVDFWGYDVDHDWGWWYKQVEYYLPFLLGKR